MSRILEVKDKSDRNIYLTEERYKHITKHPEMQNSLGIIEETIRSPEKAIQLSMDPALRYFHRHYKNRKSRAKYLRVVVKYLDGEGFVITAFYVVRP